MTATRSVIAIDLGGTNARIATLNNLGMVTALEKIEAGADTGYQRVVERLIVAGETVTAKSTTPVTDIGLASAGVIDRESGSVIESPNFPGWKQVPLARDVGAALHLPIIIENDANAAAIGEGWIGAARGWYDYLAITLGTGVGGGLVLDKQLWLGPDGAAGEIGHIPVAANGRLCGCGARGCLERYASANGVVESAQEYYLEAGAAWLRDESKNDPRQVTAKMINDGANAGDAFCLKLLSDAGERLGQMMGITALLLNVTQFVVGGGMAGALPHLERGMRTAALRTAYTLDHSILEIVPAALGDNAGLIGAAKLAFEMTSVR